MAEEDDAQKYSRLIRLIRRLAREEALQAVDEHLDDFIHEERLAEGAEEE